MLSTRRSLAAGEGYPAREQPRLGERERLGTPPAGDTGDRALADDVSPGLGLLAAHLTYQIPDEVASGVIRPRFRVEPVGRSLNRLNYTARRRARKAAAETPCASCGHLTHLSNPDGQCGFDGCTCERYISPAVRQ